MNSNPSQRTEHDYFLARRANAPRQDTEHRTFTVELASRYEVWQFATFIGRAGQDLHLTNTSPDSFTLRLTLRPNTIELPEFCWLLENFFQLAAGAHCLQLNEAQAQLAARPPRAALLTAFAEQVHRYLDMFQMPALVRSVTPKLDRAHLAVAVRNVPSPEQDPDGFERHLRICMNCIRLTYLDDGFLR
ncbi:hypothetical protein ACS5PN_11635 [Roseateles sp. NT4]|uniref:hypothetical protein n=1 Tax=Roseateles sp. NT4 TaxID=3453715 RepID=UPI003EEACA33